MTEEAMSFHVLPPGRTQSNPLAGDARAEVVDLAARRALVEPDIPAHLHHELDAAAERWHALRAEGREVRFDLPPSGGVTARLGDLEGTVVRTLPLRLAVDFDGDGPPTAA
jgi:hypothetical protein